MPEPGWTLEDWRRAFRHDGLPLEALRELAAAQDPDDPAWISLSGPDLLQTALEELTERFESSGKNWSAFPLYGVPFAVKDNIDAAGFPTTAACPAFAYHPESDAFVVAELKRAGAIVLGKTNLDQFATGLVGTRSPYGVVPNCFDPNYIGGGSSSGSASLVARGVVPFALGTDTAGSGRVPAAFQNIVGWKPTRGLLSTRGVVPACRTLDCVSIFALTVEDAALVARLLEVFDPEEPYARRLGPSSAEAVGKVTIGVPDTLPFFGDDLAQSAFQQALQGLTDLGATFEPIDFAPFAELATLLYTKSWVVERAIAAGDLFTDTPDKLDGVVASILGQAHSFSAQDAFRAEYQRAELARRIARQLESVAFMVVPTTPTIFPIAAVRADPLGTNARLGTFTNYTNLADLAALALPGPFRQDGLPAGITLITGAFREHELVPWAQRLASHYGLPLGATARRPQRKKHAQTEPTTPSGIALAVVGAHLSGMPLNHELTNKGGRLLLKTTTAPHYELHLLPGTTPSKPGLRRRSRGQGGTPIEVEVWELPAARLGDLLAQIAPPLGLGSIELVDGSWVKGFICEPIGFDGARDISAFGGFRAYQNAAR